MKIHIFENERWNQIQNNPAKEAKRVEALMICKVLPKDMPSVGPDGYIVIHIPKKVDEDVTQLGLFWTLDSAKIFATAMEAELGGNNDNTQK